MNLNDRFTRGFLAGLIAGIAMNFFSAISYYLNWVEIRFIDWAGVLIFGQLPQGVFEITSSVLGQLLFTGVLGSIYAFLIIIISSKNNIFKGILYSLFIWFTSYALGILFRVPDLTHFDLGTITSNFTGALIFGYVLALSLKWLDEKAKA